RLRVVVLRVVHGLRIVRRLHDHATVVPVALMAFVAILVAVAVMVAGKRGDGAEADGGSNGDCEKRGFHGAAPWLTASISRAVRFAKCSASQSCSRACI